MVQYGTVRSRPVIPALVGLLGLLVFLAGCGGAAAPAPPPAHDPPLGFGAPTGKLFDAAGSRSSARDVDDLPAALSGTSIWVTDAGRLERVDSVGAVTTVGLPPGTTASGRPWVSPDGTQVLAAGSAILPGSGTTPPGLAAELLIVDPSAGTVTATVPVPLPWNDRSGGQRARVSGMGPTDASLAVLSVSDDTQRTTAGIDLAARRVLWATNGVDAAIVLPTGGSLPGSAPAVAGTATPAGQSATSGASSVVGLDSRTGQRRFGLFDAPGDGLRGPTVVAAGPGLLAVAGREARRSTLLPGPSSLRFVRADGAILRTEDLGGSLSAAAPRCVWDQASTTVCSTTGSGARVFALDATTAAPLWNLPDPAANRVAPTVTTAWHGAVYGSTVNGPLVLDARTGADRDRAPGAAPVLVDPYLAVAAESSGLGALATTIQIRPTQR